jgi:hypothetical protein
MQYKNYCTMQHAVGSEGSGASDVNNDREKMYLSWVIVDLIHFLQEVCQFIEATKKLLTRVIRVSESTDY